MSINDCCSNAVLVNRYINTAYDIVKSVADNLANITIVEGSITDGSIAAAAAAPALTAADVISTAADVIITNLDVVSTGNDAAQTAADRAAVEALYDQFDDRYLGSKASAPTLDNDGNALIDGAMYFNTTSNTLYIYDAGTTTWLPQAVLDLTSPGPIGTTIPDDADFVRVNISEFLAITAPLSNFSTGSAVQVGAKTTLINTVGDTTQLSNNTYFNLGDKRQAAGFASRLQMDISGVVTLQVAVSGAADSAITWVDAFIVNNSGDLLISSGVLKLQELVAASPDSLAQGQIWVKNTNPNELWFTDDAGNDFLVSRSAATVAELNAGTDLNKLISANALNSWNQGIVEGSSTDISNTLSPTPIIGLTKPITGSNNFSVDIMLELDQAAAGADLRIQLLSGAGSTGSGVWQNTTLNTFESRVQNAYVNTINYVVFTTPVGNNQVITGRFMVDRGSGSSLTVYASTNTLVAASTIISRSWMRITELT